MVFIEICHYSISGTAAPASSCPYSFSVPTEH